MFDFAFSELMVICVVALVVLGPTRLPGVVRKVGRWIGKARAMARDFRQQLENEVTLEELNRMTERQSRSASTGPAAPEAPSGAGDAAATEPAAGTAAAPTTADASGATSAGTPGDGAGTTDPATDPMAATGYPYGMPTDTSGMSSSSARAADPSTVPDPSDDTFSHAHAPGEAPAAWHAGDDAAARSDEAETAAPAGGDAPEDSRRA